MRVPAVAGVGAGLVGVAALGLAGLATAADQDAVSVPSVVVRSEAGEVLARVPLGGRRFAVTYRNSIYKTLAESRYAVAPPGRFRLVRVAADQRAVIEEYYAIPGPDRAREGDRRRWVARPRDRAVFDELTIAATDLGERTLRVPGRRPVRLWRLVGDDDPIVVLDVQGTG
ncbi:MAG: hypothetical protein ACRDOY_11605 [Nocardioidaceae bacterium]